MTPHGLVQKCWPKPLAFESQHLTLRAHGHRALVSNKGEGSKSSYRESASRRPASHHSPRNRLSTVVGSLRLEAPRTRPPRLRRSSTGSLSTFGGRGGLARACGTYSPAR